MPAGGEKIRERGAEKIFHHPGKNTPEPLGGGYFGPRGRKMPLGGKQINGARPVVRGNHIEGALAPQAAGQRKWPRLGRVARMQGQPWAIAHACYPA